jgi:ATP-dependent helicase/nuclease subunit A
MEAVENAGAVNENHRTFAMPAPGGHKDNGIRYGNAVHNVMQHICYRACSSADGVREELARMTASGLVSQQEAELIDAEKIAGFFATDLGRRLQTAKEVLREFKFSVLENAALFDPQIVGEQVLLQGVVDCAILEEDGLIVIDFKTDYASGDRLEELVQRYTPQVTVYARALSRIYQKPVKSTALYFFSSGKTVVL